MLCIVKSKVPSSATSYFLLVSPTPSLLGARCSPALPSIVLSITCPGAQLASDFVPLTNSHPPSHATCRPINRLGPVPPNYGWALGMKPRLVPSAPHQAGGSLLGQVMPLAGMEWVSPASFPGLSCRAEQLVLLPPHPAWLLSQMTSLVEVTPDFPAITLPCSFLLISQQGKGFGT